MQAHKMQSAERPPWESIDADQQHAMDARPAHAQRRLDRALGLVARAAALQHEQGHAHAPHCADVVRAAVLGRLRERAHGRVGDGRAFSFHVHRGQLVVEIYRPRVAGMVPQPEDVVATGQRALTDLDLSIASSDVSQAELLQLDANNQVQSASAALVALLAAPPATIYRATEDASVTPAPPDEVAGLQAIAITQRPDLNALSLQSKADESYAKAQSRQHLPTITANAVGGVTPVRPDGVFGENWYAAGGVNLALPVFTGFRIRAEAKEAKLRAEASQKDAANLTNNVQRDVRTATLAAQTAFRRIAVTESFRAQAAQALSLAQTRYQLGLSSIVELSQAQLQSTQAAVAATSARYDYLLSLRSLDYVVGRIVP